MADAGSSTMAVATPPAERRAERLVTLSGWWTWSWQFGLVALELGLLVLVVQRFDLEASAFQKVLVLAFWGFLVHHLLPRAWRMPFFCLLSCASIGLVLGLQPTGWDWRAGLTRAVLLITVSTGIVLLCRLRLALWIKAAMLAGVGVCLAMLRSGYLLPPFLAPLWPIIAAMFMFRVMVYLYDVEHEAERPGLVRSLSYFLMLPNVCFPLFPVVDYKTFYRSHYNEQAAVIHQKGLNWMIRGLIQLVLYRVVYYHIYIDPPHVADGADVARCLVSNLLMYLRISGQFHLIIGLLHLFGFNLPETNRRYLLASSFTDYWRRVNIYWKDFVLKVFYNPTYFRIKKHGATTALIVSTVVCFIITWALHSYQWFWVHGRFPVTAQDTIFWGILGLLVVVNSLWEARRGRTRTLGTRTRTWSERLGLAARTAATFAVLCVLWSLWSAESVTVWKQMWSMADRTTLLYGVLVLGVIAVAAIGIDAWDALLRGLCGDSKQTARTFSSRRAVVMCLLPLAGLYVLGSVRFQARLGESGGAFLASLSRSKPNELDQDAMERGYYENLLDVARSNPQLAELYAQRSADWKKLEDTDALQPTGDFRIAELVPLKRTEVNGHVIGANRWGMRDRDYELAKPPGTFRIAVLGASGAMGWGVDDGQAFEQVLEDELNRVPPPGAPVSHFEVLNFAVNGYSAICNLVVLEKKALAFDPDAVLVIANATDDYWAKQRLAKSLRAGVEPPYAYLKELVQKAGIHSSTPEQAALWRLNRYRLDLVAWAYQETARKCQARGVVPLWALVPRIAGDDWKSKKEAIDSFKQAAAEGGYIICDLDSVYEGQRLDTLVVAKWDAHPNARGHELLGRALYQALCSEPGAKLFAQRAAHRGDVAGEVGSTAPAP